MLDKRLQDHRLEREVGIILSESGTSEEDIWSQGVNNPLDTNGKKLIQKRVLAIRRKACRQAKKKLAEKRLLKRRRSKKVGAVIRDCPGIGQEIESFVRQCGAGADMWRRTH